MTLGVNSNISSKIYVKNKLNGLQRSFCQSHIDKSKCVRNFSTITCLILLQKGTCNLRKCPIYVIILKAVQK